MKHRRNRLLTGALFAVLMGCGSTPSLRDEATVDSGEKAANVYVSAYPAIPWADIKEKLEPKHNLTTEQARAMAANVTQVEVAQFLSTFVAGLGLGFQTSAQTTTTQIAGDETRTTTGTQTRSSGAVPSAAPLTFTPPAADALAANLTAGPMAVGLDASTLLTVGTAVYQQAQILDAQISKGIEPKGYKAYLVTFQINLQPKRRNLPYDTYVNISLFPGSWKDSLATSELVGRAIDGLPPVMVYPLIITDAMEAANVGRSIEVMRNVALQLSGMIKAVGANAALGGGTNRLESLVGMDKNSLITVGRVSDHTLRIRLGAQHSGRGSAMVPRTHNVSAVVFARWDQDKTKRLKTLYAVTESTFESTEGQAVALGASRARGRLAAEVAHAVLRYRLDVKPECAATERKTRETPEWIKRRLPERFKEEQAAHDDEPLPDRYLDLLLAVERADYGYVKKCLGIQEDHDTQSDLTLRRLLAELIEIQSRSRYSKIVIALREYDDPAHPPKDQLALYSDDGKAFTTVVLRGGKGLTPQVIGAQLKLKTGKILLPDQITVRDGSHLDLRFPSFTQLDFKAADFEDPALTLSLPGSPKPVQQEYALRSIKLDTKPPGNPVSSPHSILVADAQGLARVTLLVAKVPDGMKAPIRLVVAGGDVRPDAAAGALATTSKGVMIEAEKPVTLLLGNLSPTRAVTITTMDAADKSIGDPITLTVDRLPPRGSH